MTSQVLDEIQQGLSSGLPFESLLGLNRGASFEELLMNESERALYGELCREFGRGEASCIAIASNRQYAVATDDQAARKRCKNLGIALTGTIGILLASVRAEQISPSEADNALDRMIRHGYYSPVPDVSSLLG